MRSVSRALARSKRQKGCGLVRASAGVGIRVCQDTGKGFHTGLTSCGSWSACPHCGNRIAQRRGEEIGRAIDAHRTAGGRVLFATFTSSHKAGNDLLQFYRALSESFSFLLSGSPFKRWRARLSVSGTIRATDCTHGLNGWHPHLHVLFFVKGAVSTDEIAAFQAWLYTRWSARLVAKHGLTPPSQDHGVRVELVQQDKAAGVYVAKLGIGREVSGITTKTGAGGHRTPLQILSDFARYRRSQDRWLWRQWCDAMHGQHHLHWSRGLRARLIPDIPELTDEEIAALPGDVSELDLVAVSSVAVCTIPAAVWDRTVTLPHIPLKTLHAAETGGASAVNRVLAAVVPGAPARPPAWFLAAQAAEDRAQIKIRHEMAGREMAKDRRNAWNEGDHPRRRHAVKLTVHTDVQPF